MFQPRVSRRGFLKLGAGAAAAGAVAIGLPSVRGALLQPGAAGHRHAEAGSVYVEAYPTSPLLLSPFQEPLPIPRALAPVPKSVYSAWRNPPGSGAGQQDSTGKSRHSIWPSRLGLPDPLVYQIRLDIRSHQFSSTKVLPIDENGDPAVSFDEQGRRYAPGTVRDLPISCVYGFNGTFPGPRINAEYGRPVIVRFENHLDENPEGHDLQDFGSPELGFLTHLHNGHTAPESDGNPHYMMAKYGRHGYLPKQWVDNLYLNWPAGGDDREKQSFFWFHDHFMDHTSANVYKGMVGIYPIYDPKNGWDMGDETRGLRLPGVRTNNPDGSFDVEYDVPLVFYDVRLEDGVTPHQDAHGGNGETHPEWWGESFFKHFPNHGFVGDVFTVNGAAYPVLEVKRRKYRLRFLDASISRIYELKLMSSTQGPKSAVSLGYDRDELQGQYRIPDGQQCMRFVQIATDGGLLPRPIVRDSFELWPAKRREAIVDFTKYQDGSPTKRGDVIYLTNVLKMRDGRQPDGADPDFRVPVLKIVIGDDAPDNSLIPTGIMRALPPLSSNLPDLIASRRVFEVQRGSFGGEIEWLINGLPFDPAKPLASVKQGSGEVWEIRNGGGGWVHPIHLHEEEHQVISRNGKAAPDARHPDDLSREDVVALDSSESVLIYRRFRSFAGQYVTHCHNLAHEDHAMMFGWEIMP